MQFIPLLGPKAGNWLNFSDLVMVLRSMTGSLAPVVKFYRNLKADL
jgi:hypothetical protein